MKTILFLSLSAFLATAGVSTAFAAGGGSGGSSTTAAPVVHCKKGEVLKKVKRFGFWVKKCVPIESGILPDEDLYQQGVVECNLLRYSFSDLKFKFVHRASCLQISLAVRIKSR